MAKLYTLGKDERLKSRKNIEQIFSEGKKIIVNDLRINYRLEETPGSVLRFGVGVSTKQFKKAVERNRIKRLLRETWRLQKLLLEQVLKTQKKQLHVFVIYTGTGLPLYAAVYGSMSKLIKKLETVILESK